MRSGQNDHDGRGSAGRLGLRWDRAGVVLLVSVALALATLVAAGTSSRTLAASPIACDANSQANLQAALNSGQSTITFVPDCTIHLSGSGLSVGPGVNVTIEGNGLTLDGSNGGHPVNVFTIYDTSPSTLTLNDVTVENGADGIVDPANLVTINLNSSTVRDNGIGAAGGLNSNGGNGGSGIAGASVVNLTGSTVSGNGSGGVGGTAGNGGNGGTGISGVSTVSMTDSTVSDNGSGGASGTGGNGGNGGNGISGATTIHLDNSTVSGNGSGGVSNPAGNGGNGGNGISGGSIVRIVDSTVSGNGAGGKSMVGGIGGNGGNGIAGASVVNLTDSTVSGNGTGGGGTFDNGGNGGSGIIGARTINLADSTVSGNGNGGSSVFASAGAGGHGIISAQVAVVESILASNGSTNCSGTDVADEGYNLATDGSCDFTDSTSQVVTAGSLKLLPLGSYGGPTQTIALGPGSIAIDAIPVANCTTSTDQRGIDRPQGAGCDVGAYEAPALTLSVSPGKPNGNDGWYTTKPTVTLGYGGLAVGDSAQTASCSGISGLTYTATGLDQSGSVETTLDDGTHTITSCGVSQGMTALGFSYSGPTLPDTIKVDATPPAITSPTANASYTLDQSVPLTCTDAGSGVATCAVTVRLPDGSTTNVSQGQGNDLPTGQAGVYTVTPNTVTDVAGNVDTTSFTYSVGYQLVTLPGTTTTVNRGYYAIIRIAPEDVNGVDEASRDLKVTTVELDGPNNQVIPFVYRFQFLTVGRTPEYQLELNTRSLSTGTWTLKFTIGSDTATVYSVSFRVE